MKFKLAGSLAMAGALTVMATFSTAAQDRDPENTILLKTSKGCDVYLTLFPDVAPKHVTQIKKLTQQGFYDGIVFHRVIDGFMAQTGDPTGTGMGGSNELNLPAEFSDKHFARGTLGMARSQDPNSANSQFFIMFADGGFLDGQYTVWGQVSEGMDCVDKIARGEPPATPDKIVSMKLLKDAQ